MSGFTAGVFPLKAAAEQLKADLQKHLMTKLEKFFVDADVDNSGQLTHHELAEALRKAGYKGSDEQILKFLNLADTSGDLEISKDEYLEAMNGVPFRHHSKAAMRRVFAMFDKDGNGEIDKAELKQVFEELGKFFSDSEIQRIIKIADKDNSGTLSYEEFIQAVTD